MWVPKKKWNDLEKRIADLEVRVQSQHKDLLHIPIKCLSCDVISSKRDYGSGSNENKRTISVDDLPKHRY